MADDGFPDVALEVNVKTAGLQDNGRFENYSPTSCIVCEEVPSQWVLFLFWSRDGGLRYVIMH